jgi:hypothetical protein
LLLFYRAYCCACARLAAAETRAGLMLMVTLLLPVPVFLANNSVCAEGQDSEPRAWQKRERELRSNAKRGLRSCNALFYSILKYVAARRY